MEQKNIQIGKVNVPIIIEEGEEWFPISYISEKVLLRKGSIINKSNKEKYQEFVRMFTIIYSEKNIQDANCINSLALRSILEQTQNGRLSVNQRKAQNKLNKYLGLNNIPTNEIDTNEFNNKWYKKMDSYTEEVVANEINDIPDVSFRSCSKCNVFYPMTSRFYSIDNRSDKGFQKICKICTGKVEHFTHQNDEMNSIRKKQYELYDAIRSDSIFSVYEAYRDGKIKYLPDSYENKESYLRIIEELFKLKLITENNLTMTCLMKEFKLSKINNYLTIDEVYKFLYGERFYLESWKYPKFKFYNLELTYDLANSIIRNYIDTFEVNIVDIFNFDYNSIIRNCHLTSLAFKDILYFMVQFYEFKYPGYLFKIPGVNYYKNEDNILFDLKYLIEKDLELEINKIPLYLTNYALQKKCNPLYKHIITNQNGNLFERVNKLYPGVFTETDFRLSKYRNEFDSEAEMMIHEILESEFENVIYNQRNNKQTIHINGMIPDWIIVTNNGVLIVEYYGLYEERKYGKNSRVTSYIDKTKRKIERYKEISGYKFLFFYPSDIVNDFSGIRAAINKVKDNPMFTML